MAIIRIPKPFSPPADARPSTTETTWEVEFIAPGILYVEMD